MEYSEKNVPEGYVYWGKVKPLNSITFPYELYWRDGFSKINTEGCLLMPTGRMDGSHLLFTPKDLEV